MRQKEQGQALLVVLLVMALLVILGTATLTIATHSKLGATGESVKAQAYYSPGTSGTGDEAAQAYYAAVTGVERAIAKLKIDPLWPNADPQIGVLDGDEAEGDFAGGTIEEVKIDRFSVSSSEVKAKITSTGRYRQARRKVEAQVTISHHPFITTEGGGVVIAGEEYKQYQIDSTSVTPVFGEDLENRTRVVFGGKEDAETSTLDLLITTQSGKPPVVCGDVYKKGDEDRNEVITIGGGGDHQQVIRGDAYVTADLLPYTLDRIYDDTPPDNDDVHYPSVISIPEFPELIDPGATKAAAFDNYYRRIAESYGSGNVKEGGYEFTDLSSLEGVYYVDGRAFIDGSSSGYATRATIVAKGDIIIKKNVILHPQPGSGAVRGFISRKNTLIRGSDSVDGVFWCGDTFSFYNPTEQPTNNKITGAVATWGLGYGSTTSDKNHRYDDTHDIYNADIIYDFTNNNNVNNISWFYETGNPYKDMLSRFPPGFPYTLQVDYRRQVS